MTMVLSPVIVVHGGAGDWPDGTEAATHACVQAAEAGSAALSKGASALEAVTAAVRVLEDDPSCNAGTGAVLTRAGTLELDACVADGATLASGAVACLPPFKHPIDVAKAVLEDGRYHLLAGPGAAEFARAHGFAPADPESMILDERSTEIEHKHGAPPAPPRAGDTVGAVALDATGTLAAATSTGGLAGVEPGRVGDSPIVGAGTYANAVAACSCTGDGEAFARACAAFWTVDRASANPQAVAERSLARVHDTFHGFGGLIVVNRRGEVGVARTMPSMPHAIAFAGAPVSAGA